MPQSVKSPSECSLTILVTLSLSLSLSCISSFSHLDAVRSVAFGEDDTSVVSGSDDMTIKLWRFSPNSYVSRPSSLLPLTSQ
jgi:WD40 repeat protein